MPKAPSKKYTAEKDYSATEIAKLCDISLARVGQLAKEGVLTRLSSGRYPADAIPQYIKYLRGQNKRTDYSELLDKEKYREIKRRNDLEEKKVAPVELFQVAIEKAANIQIPILESLPLIMKRNWPEITGDQIALVKKSIAECRNAIAESRIDI